MGLLFSLMIINASQCDDSGSEKNSSKDDYDELKTN